MEIKPSDIVFNGSQVDQSSLLAYLISILPSYGELVILDSSTPTDLTTQNDWYQVTAGWTVDQTNNTTPNAEDGTITADVAGQYLTLAAISFISGAAPETLQFGIFKNGSLISGHTGFSWTDTETYPNVVTLVGIDELAVGDVLDVRARCTTAPSIAITVQDCNFNISSL